MIDPIEINALSAAMLEHLRENCAASLESQVAALRVSAETIEASMSANMSAEMKQGARNFWNKRK